MASFPNAMLTNNGLELLTKAQGGIKLKFTRIGMGDGELGSRSISELNHLINEKVSVEISIGHKQNISEYLIGGFFSNVSLDIGFAWREIGIYAMDPDRGEILYSYSNARDNPDYIPGVSGGLWEKNINLKTAIGNASNVTVEFKSVIYVSEKEFKGHTANTDVHSSPAEKQSIATHISNTETHVTTLTHTRNSTLHTLSPIPTADGIYTAQFKATADYMDGDTFNGYTAKPMGEDIILADRAFVTGDLVTVVIDTTNKKLGFKLGGGGVNETLPSQITGFIATAGNAQVTLSWTNPTSSFTGLVIMRKIGSMPTGVKDGVKVYDGIGTGHIDTTVTNGTIYYYRAFPYNAKKQYQTEIDGGVVSAIPIAMLALGDLPVGTLVKALDSKYYDAPIVWKIADKNHTGYPANSVTLISDKILTLKCFDAKEPSNVNNDRKTFGNNRYIYSNIRQWLNSNSDAGKWYTAQHIADAQPDATNTNYNPYVTQSGFLNKFSDNLKNALLETTLIVAKNTVTDGGGSETFTNKIFLASTTEVGLANENNVVEGTKIALFGDNASRLAYPTAQTVSNSIFKDTVNLTVTKPWNAWLRTPVSNLSMNVRSISTVGALGNRYAYDGSFGIRPLCNLASSNLVSLIPDTDGAYILVEM